MARSAPHPFPIHVCGRCYKITAAKDNCSHCKPLIRKPPEDRQHTRPVRWKELRRDAECN